MRRVAAATAAGEPSGARVRARGDPGG
jgi:hypothetical protein